MKSEYQNYKLFFSEKHKSHRRLVFYSERDIYYQTFGPFLEQLLKNQKITCSYITSDKQDPILTNPPKNVYPFYFNFFLKSVFDKMDARCFVFTMPDLDTYHLKRSTHTKEYIYLFHAFSSVHLQYNEKAFDAYDTIFCVGPHHVQEIQKREQLYHLPQKRLLPIGYPRMDTVYQAFQHYQKQSSETTILVAPTWSTASLLENGIDALIDALAQTNYHVIVRPHPEFLKRRSNRAKALKQRLESLPQFTWEDQLLSENSLYEADLLITDRSGIAFEYAFGTERPVIFIETPFKEHNPHWKDLKTEPIELQLRSQIGVCVELDHIPNINETIHTVLENKNTWTERLRLLREQTVFHWGHSAIEGSQYIENQLKMT